jgi:hypothetical protein
MVGIAIVLGSEVVGCDRSLGAGRSVNPSASNPPKEALKPGKNLDSYV